MNCVQLEFVWPRIIRRTSRESALRIGPTWIPLRLVPNRRARRYVLRLTHDGAVRVTVPRGGSLTEAARFAERHIGWIEQQIYKHSQSRQIDRRWQVGREILWRGESFPLELVALSGRSLVRFGSELVSVGRPEADLRPDLELHMRRIAAAELPARVLELAALNGFSVRRVTVRNQRSRWGSCSRRGTISLNWRLVQTPEFVRDYIILHELAHLREMNHSRRFWREVERVCPRFLEAERWLKDRPALLN